MHIQSLMGQHVPTVARCILRDANMPVHGMLQTLVASFLNEETGSQVWTEANGHWVIKVTEDCEALNRALNNDPERVIVHMATQRLIKGLLGEHYHSVVRQGFDQEGRPCVVELHLLPVLRDILN